MTEKDRIEIERRLGIIEGFLVTVDSKGTNYIFDVLDEIDSILAKEENADG